MTNGYRIPDSRGKLQIVKPSNPATNLIAAALILILTLALCACGSGGAETRVSSASPPAGGGPGSGDPAYESLAIVWRSSLKGCPAVRHTSR